MRASISFSLTADEGSPPHPNVVTPSTHAQLPQIPLSGSDDEDPIPRRPVIKHPLFLYRIFLIISIFFVIVIAAIFPGGYYEEGIWVAPLYGHTLSFLIAIYDLYDYEQTLYFHLRDQVRHGRDSDARLLPQWLPKRRFVVIDTLLVFYYIGVALIYLFVVSRSPYYGGRDTPFYITAALSIVMFLAGICHSVCANKEMNARSKMQRHAEEWACACTHCAQVQTIVNANRRRGQHVRAVTVAEPPSTTNVEAASPAESESAMEEGLLARADLSGYGTVVEEPQATQVVKKGKAKQTGDNKITGSGDVTGSNRLKIEELMDREDSEAGKV